MFLGIHAISFWFNFHYNLIAFSLGFFRKKLIHTYLNISSSSFWALYRVIPRALLQHEVIK